MSNVVRFFTKNNNSKSEKLNSINSGCEIVIFPGIRYSRSENSETSDIKLTKRRRNTMKTSIEPKRKRGT